MEEETVHDEQKDSFGKLKLNRLIAKGTASSYGHSKEICVFLLSSPLSVITLSPFD